LTPKHEQGFTYLTVLFIVAILMTGLALVGEVWETAAKRDKETELLFIGNQYRQAIARFYEGTPGGVKRYPRTLEELLKDPRAPSTQRYLRQLYPDPLGSKEWGIVKAPDGGVAGVYSQSEDKPLKTGNFKLRDAGFDGAQRYVDWKFLYSPAAAAQTAPQTTPQATQPGVTGTPLPGLGQSAPAAGSPLPGLGQSAPAAGSPLPALGPTADEPSSH
jgi:type II secretory pathway pseudopilin PulG